MENICNFSASCSIEHCENGGTCEHDICLCNDGFVGSKCEIGMFKVFLGKRKSNIF